MIPPMPMENPVTTAGGTFDAYLPRQSPQDANHHDRSDNRTFAAADCADSYRLGDERNRSARRAAEEDWISPEDKIGQRDQASRAITEKPLPTVFPGLRGSWPALLT